jgi:hypothetical protein
MDEQDTTQVSDEDIQTVFTGTGTVATVADPQDADGTDADDPQDADGTDADDVQDADGTDGDATDGTDGDAGDADGRDA